VLVRHARLAVKPLVVAHEVPAEDERHDDGASEGRQVDRERVSVRGTPVGRVDVRARNVAQLREGVDKGE